MKIKCQIFLIVGYLGAGKTTFIKNLIKIDDLASKMAIIQNQFSEQMGIQSPLIVNSEGTPFKDFLELPNGCICCSAKNDLIAAIEYLTEKSNIKYIVIQTNGVADPAQSIKQFWLDDNMDISAKLHSIVTIVPTHRMKEISQDIIFKKQIIFSNKVLLGFLDKASDSQIKQTVQYIKEINPLITIFQGTDPQVYNKIFQGDFFQIKDIKQLSQHSHNHEGIQSIVIKFPQLSSSNQFQKNVGTLLWQHPEFQIMRIKGLILSKDKQMICQLQGVDDTFEIKESSIEKSISANTKILLIGKNLSRQKISQILLRQME